MKVLSIIVALFAFALVNIPIAFAIIASTLLILWVSGVPMSMQIQRMVAGINSFPLLAVPLYILAGSLMESSGITPRLFKLADALAGHIRGGLGHVNVVASMIMAGMSGSAMADCAVTSKIFVPEMVRAGYPKPFSAAITAASSIIGPIIPPSIIFVVYGCLTGVSVGRLFIAGAVPGVMIGLYQMIAVYLISKRQGFGEPTHGFSWSRLWNVIKQTWAALFLPPLILGGILTGAFTPTEAGGIAVAYSLLVGLFIHRTLTLKDFVNALESTAASTAAMMFIVAAAAPFGWILGLEQVPQLIARIFTSISTNPYVILSLINILYLFLGTFMDITPIQIITIPMLLPIINQLGIDLIHFGVVSSIGLLIGAITPPVGTLMYCACEISDVTIEDFLKAVWPFYVALIGVLFTVTYIPALALWLPKVVLG
jgi:C4-dicarboxylate transporter DctM subunit